SSNHAPPALGFQLRRRCSANPPLTAIYNERRRRVQPIGNTGRVCLRVKVLVRSVVSSLKQFLRTAASRADWVCDPIPARPPLMNEQDEGAQVDMTFSQMEGA